jgi:hypothetical protein
MSSVYDGTGGGYGYLQTSDAHCYEPSRPGGANMDLCPACLRLDAHVSLNPPRFPTKQTST